MTASLSGEFNFQAIAADGTPIEFARVYTYTAGTTTQKTAYTDAAASVAHTYTSDGSGGQYIATNARGEIPAPLFLTTGAYDIALKDAAGAAIWTRRAQRTDDYALTIEANLAASSGSSGVGFLQAGTGAVSRTVESKCRDIVSVLDWGTTTALIDKAKAAAAAAGAMLFFPAGVYTVTPATAQTGAANYNCAFEIVSNMHWVGERGATIKLADNYSTDASPKELALCSSSLAVSKVSFSGLTFDLNGANNLMNPGRLANVAISGASGTGVNATVTYAAQPFAVAVGSIISVSGMTPAGYNTGAGGATVIASTASSVTYANTTVAAFVTGGQVSGGYKNVYNHAAIMFNGPTGRADDVDINGCVFQNNAGVCFIVAALVATGTAPTLGQGWRITENKFLNGGKDSSDHTSVYAWCEDVVCDNNRFLQSLPPRTVGKTGGATGYEVHGSNQRFTNNYIVNYTLGMYIAPNFTSTTVNTIVQSNIFYCSDYGILLWRAVAVGYLLVDGVIIDDNEFYFDNYTYAGQPAYKAAIAYQGQIATAQGAVNNVKITNNQALNVGTTLLSQFVRWDTSTTAAQLCSNLIITDNTAKGFTDGVYMITNATNGQGYTKIAGNDFIEFTPDTLGNPPHGVYITADAAGPVKTLVIDGNQFIDERGSPQFANGVFLNAGTITDLYLGPQVYKGITTPYTDVITVTNWLGPQRLGKATIAYSASMTPNASAAQFQVITVTNTTAMAINAPTRKAVGMQLTFQIKNSSGAAMGAIAWNAVFAMSAWTNPINGQNRSITFVYDGSFWVQISATGVDVPN